MTEDREADCYPREAGQETAGEHSDIFGSDTNNSNSIVAIHPPDKQILEKSPKYLNRKSYFILNSKDIIWPSKNLWS